MTKSKRKALITALATLGLIAVLIASFRDASAQSTDWPLSSGVTTLTYDEATNLNQRTALALSPSGDSTVIWTEEDVGVHMRSTDGDTTWSSTQLLSSTHDALRPDIAYVGSELWAAWVNGANPGTLVPYDIPDGISQRPVMTDVYGTTAPKIVAGPNGAHMIFAAATSYNEIMTETDIFYSYRSKTNANWEKPVPVITEGKEIFYPQIALSPDGLTVHIVWERNRSIWHAAGHRDHTNKLSWDVEPHQISPPSGEEALRPAITIDPYGAIHVVWGHPVDETGRPPQSIFYQRLDINGTPVIEKKLNNDNLKVNDQLPRWVEFSIGSNASRVCVSWHGHYEAAEGSGVEEIWMRCSDDLGITWRTEVNVSNSAQEPSLFSNLEIEEDGTVHVTWVEYKVANEGKMPQSLSHRSGPSSFRQVFLPLVLRGAQ